MNPLFLYDTFKHVANQLEKPNDVCFGLMRAVCPQWKEWLDSDYPQTSKKTCAKYQHENELLFTFAMRYQPHQVSLGIDSFLGKGWPTVAECFIPYFLRWQTPNPTEIESLLKHDRIDLLNLIVPTWNLILGKGHDTNILLKFWILARFPGDNILNWLIQNIDLFKPDDDSQWDSSFTLEQKMFFLYNKPKFVIYQPLNHEACERTIQRWPNFKNVLPLLMEKYRRYEPRILQLLKGTKIKKSEIPCPIEEYEIHVNNNQIKEMNECMKKYTIQEYQSRSLLDYHHKCIPPSPITRQVCDQLKSNVQVGLTYILYRIILVHKDFDDIFDWMLENTNFLQQNHLLCQAFQNLTPEQLQYIMMRNNQKDYFQGHTVQMLYDLFSNQFPLNSSNQNLTAIHNHCIFMICLYIFKNRKWDENTRDLDVKEIRTRLGEAWTDNTFIDLELCTQSKYHFVLISRMFTQYTNLLSDEPVISKSFQSNYHYYSKEPEWRRLNFYNAFIQISSSLNQSQVMALLLPITFPKLKSLFSNMDSDTLTRVLRNYRAILWMYSPDVNTLLYFLQLNEMPIVWSDLENIDRVLKTNNSLHLFEKFVFKCAQNFKDQHPQIPFLTGLRLTPLSQPQNPKKRKRDNKLIDN